MILATSDLEQAGTRRLEVLLFAVPGRLVGQHRAEVDLAASLREEALARQVDGILLEEGFHVVRIQPRVPVEDERDRAGDDRRRLARPGAPE